MISTSKEHQTTLPEPVADDAAKTDTGVAPDEQHAHVAQNAIAPQKDLPASRPSESGGQAGLEPTRYGDWEKKGRCTDF